MSDHRTSFADTLKSLKRLGFDSDYDPAKHYMRGPGPKTLARQGLEKRAEEAPAGADQDVPSSGDTQG